MQTENKVIKPAYLPASCSLIKDDILENTLKTYEFIIVSTMQNIVNRYSRRPGYKWIDTKFDSITGADFGEHDPVKGLNIVYAWIQGRGLEAAIAHIRWLKSHTQDLVLIKELEMITHDILYHLREIRNINNGRLFFSFTTEGTAYDPINQKIVDLGMNMSYNFSDLFCAKGMYAAAHYLDDAVLIEESKQYCMDVISAILDKRFVNDQFAYDDRNFIPLAFECHSHAPYSLALSTIILLLEHEKDKSVSQKGLDLLEHVIENHVNIDSRWPQLDDYALVEFIDNIGQPYLENGRILGDPGHAIEFAGYGIKFYSILNQLGFLKKNKLEKFRNYFINIIDFHFTIGFNSKFGGIFKSVDLLKGVPINSDMPWWSLPETMKAALTAYGFVEPQYRQFFLDIYLKCNKSFLNNYVRTKPRLLIAQTRNGLGEMVNVVPAVPDNDPGYHTGMSLLDCYAVLEKIISPESA